MRFKPRRLGPGDWLAFIAAVLLLADLIAGRWFTGASLQPGGPAVTRHTRVVISPALTSTAWQSFDVVAAAGCLVCAAAIAAALLTASRRSPAIPVALTTLLTPWAALLTLLLALRLLLLRPRDIWVGGALSARAEGYAGLALSVLLTTGCYLALRRDGVPDDDTPVEIELIAIDTAAPRTDT